MSDANSSTQTEKAAKIRRKPERENVLSPTFAAVRQTAPDRRQSRPSEGSLLQRQCRCGKHTIAGGVCEECQQKGEAAAPHTPAELGPATPPDIQTTRDNAAHFNLSHVPARTRPPANGQSLQPSLTVNAPGDQYEQEADRVAETVMRMPTPPPPSPSTEIDSFLHPTVSRLPAISQIQTSGGDGAFQAPAKVETRINQMQGGGQPLPDTERDFFEERMGYDFSNVRVHTDANAVQANRDIQARAFTIGNNIAFNEGAYRPGTDEGRRLLAHELTHVAQQVEGKQLVQRQGFTSPVTFRQRLFSRWFTLDPGNSLTASLNVRRSPEDCQMPDNFYVYLYNVATSGYETTVRYPVDASAHYTWKGLSGGAYQFILRFNENVSAGCNLTGTLEVKQETAINDIVPTARRYIGSTTWAYDTDRPPYGPGTNKCNLFVYEILNEAGAAVQMIERYRWGISRGQHPPLAGQWANSSFSIAGWRVVSTPQPGDVIAEAHEYSDASGHMGIVSSVSADGTTGTTISAATSGSVVENDWGFRSGQSPVFRRYTGR